MMKILIGALIFISYSLLVMLSQIANAQPVWTMYGTSYEATVNEQHEFQDWFGVELYFRYMFLANVELNQGDYLDADRYVIMARRAVAGDYELTDQIHYNLSDEDRSRFSSAKKRLENILPTAKEFDIELASQAQLLYHCALDEAEETPRQCEEGFWIVLGKLEYRYMK